MSAVRCSNAGRGKKSGEGKANQATKGARAKGGKAAKKVTSNPGDDELEVDIDDAGTAVDMSEISIKSGFEQEVLDARALMSAGAIPANVLGSHESYERQQKVPDLQAACLRLHA